MNIEHLKTIYEKANTLDSISENIRNYEKHTKGYMFDSLAFRFKEALERGTNARVQKLMDLGLTKGEAITRAAKQNQRDEMRFIQILDEAIGEHD